MTESIMQIPTKLVEILETSSDVELQLKRNSYFKKVYHQENISGNITRQGSVREIYLVKHYGHLEFLHPKWFAFYEIRDNPNPTTLYKSCCNLKF